MYSYTDYQYRCNLGRGGKRHCRKTFTEVFWLHRFLIPFARRCMQPSALFSWTKWRRRLPDGKVATSCGGFVYYTVTGRNNSESETTTQTDSRTLVWPKTIYFVTTVQTISFEHQFVWFFFFFVVHKNPVEVMILIPSIYKDDIQAIVSLENKKIFTLALTEMMVVSTWVRTFTGQSLIYYTHRKGVLPHQFLPKYHWARHWTPQRSVNRFPPVKNVNSKFSFGYGKVWDIAAPIHWDANDRFPPEPNKTVICQNMLKTIVQTKMISQPRRRSQLFCWKFCRGFGFFHSVSLSLNI